MLKLSLEEMKKIMSDADISEAHRLYAIGIVVAVFERANDTRCSVCGVTEGYDAGKPACPHCLAQHKPNTLTPKDELTLIAVYRPQSLDYVPSDLVKNIGKMICTWTYAFTITDVDYYETNDLRFNSIDAFPETDLEIKDEDCEINHTCSCDDATSNSG